MDIVLWILMGIFIFVLMVVLAGAAVIIAVVKGLFHVLASAVAPMPKPSAPVSGADKPTQT